MTKCSGNHFIIAFYIDTDKLICKYIHEKDESGKDNYGITYMETACIVNKDLKILDTGLSHTIMDSQSFKDVDDISVFCFNNIIVECNQAVRKEVNKRDKNNLFIIDVFTAYIEHTLNTVINILELDTNENKVEDKEIIHWVFTVPDDWNDKYFDTFKSQLRSTNVESIDTLILVRNSDALIRHLQIAHYNNSFVNGEYCIITLFKEDNKVVLYGYEIGPPIKGLKNVADHTRKELKSIPVDYHFDKYLLNTIFNGDKTELEEYSITLESLNELCKEKYWDYHDLSFYKVISTYKTEHLRNVKDSFLVEKEDVLKSIGRTELVDNMEMPTAYYARITNEVAEISRKYNNVRAIVVNDTYFINFQIIKRLIDLLLSNLKTKHHYFNLSEGMIFTSGAAQIVQSQLKIDNHLPQVRNIDTLEAISKGNMMYIDINWNGSSVLYIDSNRKETFIENTSDALENCYSLEDCFQVIHHEHQFHLSSITINDKYKKILKLDKESVQKSSHSRKKKNSNPNKAVEPINANSASELSMKLLLSDIVNTHLKNKSLLYHTPRDQQQELLIMYIKCVHDHIIQHLLSRGVLDNNDSFTTYFSIDQSILKTFLIDYEKARTIFNESNTTHIWSHPMKLIQREQLSAVRCKDTIKCFKRVEEHLDYPQYIMQVQLYSAYIDLTLNAVMALNKDITLTNNETVLTLKRKRISFNIVDVMSELLWDYIQSREASPISICHKHKYLDYEDDVSMYIDFMSHFRYWFTHEYTMIDNQGKSEWNKEIPMKMNTQCDCTLLITPMDLFDICIIPAIQQMMAIVYGATTNTHIFGDTRIQHIILMGSIMKIKCNTTHTEALYLLKDYIKKQNKYYNHITLHWSEEKVSKMVYEGIKSIKINPSGGLLEQIISGKYSLQFEEVVYFDFQKSIVLDPAHSFTVIKSPTVVTEDMRETGRLSYYYHEGEQIELDLFYSLSKQEESKLINSFKIMNIDSFPITVKWNTGLKEVIFCFGAGAEGNASIDTANSDRYCMRENLILSPYV